MKKIFLMILVGFGILSVVGCGAQRREVILQGNEIQGKIADDVVQDMYTIATYKNTAMTLLFVEDAIRRASAIESTGPVIRSFELTAIESKAKSDVKDGLQTQEHLRWLYTGYSRSLSLRDRSETYIRSQESWVELTTDNLIESYKEAKAEKEIKVDEKPIPTSQPSVK